MVDISGKSATLRSATAVGRIEMQAATLALITQGNAKKGDVLGVARIAAIQAAKRTSDLIPLCHPIALTKVAVEFEIQLDPPAVHVSVTAQTVGQTGVEMEALTAASAALLTVYDMCKAVDRGMTLHGIGLAHKVGGKSGEWQRELAV